MKEKINQRIQQHEGKIAELSDKAERSIPSVQKVLWRQAADFRTRINELHWVRDNAIESKN
jgi:hypothetical protein